MFLVVSQDDRSNKPAITGVLTWVVSILGFQGPYSNYENLKRVKYFPFLLRRESQRLSSWPVTTKQILKVKKRILLRVFISFLLWFWVYSSYLLFGSSLNHCASYFSVSSPYSVSHPEIFGFPLVFHSIETNCHSPPGKRSLPFALLSGGIVRQLTHGTLFFRVIFHIFHG